MLKDRDMKLARMMHPEREAIFKLEEYLEESRQPYSFNFRTTLRDGASLGLSPMDIDWNKYPFRIDVCGAHRGFYQKNGFTPMTVTFSTGSDKKLLEILDRRDETDPDKGKVIKDLDVHGCYAYLSKLFH